MPVTIGVFDSGVGGKSVADAIRRAFPAANVLFVNDHEHMPYGDKPPAEVLKLAYPKLVQLAEAGCDVIVVACNTVTTHFLDTLRARFDIPLIGVEPMLRQAAAATRARKIAVCATPSTLHSQRYDGLKRRYAADCQVLEPDCSGWAYMIENNTLNRETVRRQIEDVCAAGADMIVLGCTHYHWIEDLITEAAAGRAAVVQPEPDIIRRLAALFPALR